MPRNLHARLRNWGDWLNHENDIAPPDARCISIEARYLPDAGGVFEAVDPAIVPDVPDAEAINALVQQLPHLMQYALAIRYGGLPCVFRPRRMGEHAMQRQADLGEAMLREALAIAA